MNKKFFTLLVAFLATMSFGAFAQIATGDLSAFTGRYASNKTYLFESSTSTGNYLSVKMTTGEQPKLVLVGTSELTTLSAFQLASWRVTVKPGGSDHSLMTLVNDYTGLTLAFDAEGAFVKGSNGDKNNEIKGGIVEWFTVDQITKATPTRLYVRTEVATEYVGLALDGNNVYPMLISTDPEADPASKIGTIAGDFEQFIPTTAVSGTFVLSPNDLNTHLGVKGVYDNGAMSATNDSYFQFTITPPATKESPVTKELQAQAFIRADVAYGKNGTDITDPSEVVLNAAFNSIRKEGTIRKKDGNNYVWAIKENEETKAVSNKNADWYVLKVKDGKYLVVDTEDWTGTAQEMNKRIKLAEADLYDAKGATKYRLPESYMFRVTYDAKNSSYQLQSKAYVLPSYDANGKVIAASKTTDNAQFYSGGYATGPVKKGDVWLNTAAQNDPNLAGQNRFEEEYLTFAKLVDETVYTLGEVANSEFKMVLNPQKEYTPIRLTSGVYVVTVAGVADKKNHLSNEGKVLKANMAGYQEYADIEVRQNYHHMPAAQWVLERGGTTSYPTAKLTNREFGFQYYGLGNGGITYDAGKTEDGKQQIFFFGGDTLVIDQVSVENTKNQNLGYAKVENGQLDLYSLEWLHDLSMNRPVTSIDEKDSALWVNAKNDDKMFFVFEKYGETDQYGYNGDLTNVSQLVRDMYLIKVSQHFTFENRYITYNQTSKKYYLTDDKENAIPFLLKENNEVENDSCYYALLRANYLTDLSLITWDKDAEEWVPAAPGSTKKYNMLRHDLFKDKAYAYVVGEKGENTDENGIKIKDNWVPKVYANQTEIPAGWEAVETSTNSGKYYATKKSNSVASNRVAVDNNSLSLVNGAFSDAAYSEVNVAAFRLMKDGTKLYRTVEVDDKNEALIKIHREYEGQEYLFEDANSQYAVEPLGPNKAKDRLNIYDQINFLGIENKQNTEGEKVATLLAKYQRGTVMPQYLLMFDKQEIQEEVELPCEVHGVVDGHGPKEMQLTGYSGRFLVTFADSVKLEDKKEADKYKWQSQTRLGFVYGRVDKNYENLTILNSSLDADKNVIKIKNEDKEGPHVNGLFSFRYVEPGSDKFLIECAGPVGGNDKNVWVQIKNGVPVLTGAMKFAEAIDRGAEVFNLKVSEQEATSNTGIEDGKYSVVAGEGVVTIKGAAGKQVVVANILGQVVANSVLNADEETITVPAGVVVVSVDGEATKALVK